MRRTILVGVASMRREERFLGSVMKRSCIADCETNAMALATELPFCEWWILSNARLAGNTVIRYIQTQVEL